MKMTRIMSLVLATTIGVGLFASCGDSDGATVDNALSYISLRVNPEIELLADEDGVVVSVNAVNEDGEVLLTTVDLEGKSVEEAGAIFTEAANDLGYLTPDGEKDTVYVGVEGGSDSIEEDLEEKLNKSIRDYFNNNGINGKISPETLDKYADKANEWGLSMGHTKLVMRVLDTHPELTDEDVIDLSVKEWMQLLKGDKAEEKIAAGLLDAYRAEVQALKAAHAEMFTLRTQVKALEELLGEKLSDEEKSAFKAQLSQLEEALKPLEKIYEKALADIQDYYKDASKELRKEYEKEAKKREDENKGKNAA